MEMEKLIGSIVSNYVALYYNEQLKDTKFYKQNLKNKLNNAILELQKHEKNEFDKVFEADDETTHQVSSNLITFIDEIVKNGFTSQMLISNMIMAHKKNPKAIEGIVDKVLNS